MPREIRDDIQLLYLVLRTLDDLVDEGDPAAEARVAAAEAWARDDRAPEATSETEVLDDLARRHPLPRAAVAAFCAGMRQDLARDSFARERDVDLYCYRVAGTVGVLMTSILGARNRDQALPAAAALGMAMQRTNILRDIDEDLVAGRVYIARETLDRHGSLAPQRRGPLVRDQIARADALYTRGLRGLGELRQGRRAVAAAAGMYREILREIERQGCGRIPGRTVVPRTRRIRVAAKAALAA